MLKQRHRASNMEQRLADKDWPHCSAQQLCRALAVVHTIAAKTGSEDAEIASLREALRHEQDARSAAEACFG